MIRFDWGLGFLMWGGVLKIGLHEGTFGMDVWTSL